MPKVYELVRGGPTTCGFVRVEGDELPPWAQGKSPDHQRDDIEEADYNSGFNRLASVASIRSYRPTATISSPIVTIIATRSYWST